VQVLGTTSFSIIDWSAWLSPRWDVFGVLEDDWSCGIGEGNPDFADVVDFRALAADGFLADGRSNEAESWFS